MLAYDGYSDADVKHRPSGAQWKRCDPEWVQKVYLSKIAQKYMEESGQAETGKSALLFFVFAENLRSPVLSSNVFRIGSLFSMCNPEHLSEASTIPSNSYTMALILSEVHILRCSHCCKLRFYEDCPIFAHHDSDAIISTSVLY